MDDIRKYLLGVVASAMLCSVLTVLVDKKSMVGVATKLLAGLLLTLAVVRPWVSISVDGLFGWVGDISYNGTDIVSQGKEMAQEAYCAGIKQRLEAYILEKAKALGAELEVEVTVHEDGLPVPKMVIISGAASPYAKQVIGNYLTEELGLKREDQIWTE